MPTKRSTKPIAWGDDLVLTSPPTTCRRRNQQKERAEQASYFEVVDDAARRGLSGADMIYSIRNETGFGGTAGLRVGAGANRAGRKKGVPDICVAVPQAGCPGLYIELKRRREDGGRPSDVRPEQRDWHERLRRQGYRVEVCFGWIDAYDTTASYLGWDGVDRAKARARTLAEECSNDN